MYTYIYKTNKRCYLSMTFNFLRLVPDTSESELSESEALFTRDIFPAPDVTRELPSSDDDWFAKLLVVLAFSNARTATQHIGLR